MAKKTAGSGAPLAKTAATFTAIEREVQNLLDENDEGNIDNVFDIIDELTDYEERLPATSRLRPAWDEFYAGCMQSAVASEARRSKNRKK